MLQDLKFALCTFRRKPGRIVRIRDGRILSEGPTERL
jgi:hypothetical protein